MDEEDAVTDSTERKERLTPPKPIPQGFDKDGNRIIPPQLEAYFTANEANELIAMFEGADKDKSGTVDEEEFRNLLVALDIHISDEEADKLVIEVDTNKNGLIEWDEFVAMIAKAKRGDVRFSKLHSMTDALKTTPVAMLEAEAEKFGLIVEFKLLEERKATNYNPKTFVMGVSITIKSKSGDPETESFEAIGFTSREAKFKVAELALVKMKKLKPGFEFPPGVIPQNWESWTTSNLRKGVHVNKILRMLVEKGFVPATNLNFMKKLSIQVAFLNLSKEFPGELVFPNSMNLTTPWCRWVDEQIGRGMDCSLVLQQLEQAGYDKSKDPRFVQRLLQPPNESCVQYDFWHCINSGNLHETKLFISGGQNVNEEKLDRHSKVVYTPLQLASKLGYLSLVEFFLLQGADVHMKNTIGRTALILAAKHAHPAVVKILLAHKASPLDRDNMENTALHMAAFSGCTRSCVEILTFQEDYLRACVVNTKKELNFMDQSRSFRGILRSLFQDMMEKKLPRNVRPTFSKSWLYEAVRLAYDKIFEIDHPATKYVSKPSEKIIARILHRYRYLQNEIVDTGDEVEVQQQEKDAVECILTAKHLEIYLENCFLEAFKNTPNKQGRTPLHLACDENLVCSHEGTLRVLVDVFGCDSHLEDNMGKTPLALLRHRKHRPGSPKESRELEVMLQQARARRRANHSAQRQQEKDSVLREAFEKSLLEHIPREPNSNDFDFVHAKENSILVNTVGPWKEYMDLQSRNQFYEHVGTGQMQLTTPQEVFQALEERKQWYCRRKSSRILEKKGEWTMHKHAQKQRVFFYNTETGQYQWTKPIQVDNWVNIPSNIKRALESGDNDDENDSDEDKDEARESINEISEKLLRVFGIWEEHKDAATGGRVYYNTTTKQITRQKPDLIIREELKRQAYTLLIKKAEFKDRFGDWDKYYDPPTEHYFLFNRVTGVGLHETEYDEATLRLEAIQAEAKNSTTQLIKRLTDEEISKKQDSELWLNVLRRSRRRDTIKTLIRKEVVDDETRRLNALNDALLRKIHADFANKSMGYRDVRLETEQKALAHARSLGLFVSEKIAVPLNIATSEAMEYTEWMQAEEMESQSLEDTDTNPSYVGRRRVLRLIEDSQWRLDANYSLCFWGCRLWCLLGIQKDDHEHDECRRRLGCPMYHEAHEWQSSHGDRIELDWHEIYECNSRLTKCPRDCGAWVPNDQLQYHCDYTCIKRPVPDLTCRIGCGKVFQGANNRILELEQERKWHEFEECTDRIVTCNWPGCTEQMMAKERKLHRKVHLCASGITTFKSGGSFEFVVPKSCRHIKVQAWGGGGGSGVLHGYKFGHGGGGAFVEAILQVHPGEPLMIVVGEGGQGGVFGQTNPSDTMDGLPLVAQVGQAFGGAPGGGAGYSSNNGWACGGGGGYTSLCRKGPYGIITLLLVGGGGGAGCRDGLGGSDEKEIKSNMKRDLRCGEMGTPSRGGIAGSVSTPNYKFLGTNGDLYQGGNGAEFGGGGGGGYYGSGGGGYSPGIVGGGSTFIDSTLLDVVIVERANKRIPGGIDFHPPSCLNGGVCGEGGLGSLKDTCNGNDGCIRIGLPGFYSNMDFETQDDEIRK